MEKNITNKYNNKIKKEFKFFAPLVSSYIEAVYEINDKANPKSINNLLKAKFAVKSGKEGGFTDIGGEVSFPNFSKVGEVDTSISYYTMLKDYNIDPLSKNPDYSELINIIENKELENAVLKSGAKQLQDIDRIDLILCAIHEFNHATSTKKHIMTTSSGEEVTNGAEVDEVDLENSFLEQYNGGIKLRSIGFGAFKKPRFISNNISGIMLHEGITEILTGKILKTKAFAKYFKDNNFDLPKIYNPSYQPYVMLVEGYERIYDNTLSKNYWGSPNISEKDEEIISKIVNDISKMTVSIKKYFDFINNKRIDNDYNMQQENKLFLNFIEEIKNVELAQTDRIKLAYKNNKISKEDCNQLIQDLKQFSTIGLWKGYLNAKLGLVNSDTKQAFMNRFTDAMNKINQTETEKEK